MIKMDLLVHELHDSHKHVGDSKAKSSEILILPFL